MKPFNTSLPDDLYDLLNEKARALGFSQNELVERVLRIYLDQLNKAAYLKSFKQMKQDTDVLKLAEEGMADYSIQLNNPER